MNVLIISGFLGAGKTTFIKHLIEHIPHRRFAILENEFGETDMDAKLLGQTAGNMNIWEMTENCVCCTGKADFLTNVMTISSALDPDVLIVEPTGVAKLGVLIQNIEGLGYDKVKMVHPLTIVDPHAFFHEKERYDEIYLDQIKHSKRILISKSETMDQAEIDHVIESLKELVPAAEFTWGDYAKQPNAWWESLLDDLITKPMHQEKQHHDHDHEHHHDHDHEHDHEEEILVTFTISGARLPTPVHLMTLLDLVVGNVFGEIPRAKGFLPCGTKDEWIRFDLVDREWIISGFPPQEESKLTFIGPKVNGEEIQKFISLFEDPN